jgi:hypothetical protein
VVTLSWVFIGLGIVLFVLGPEFRHFGEGPEYAFLNGVSSGLGAGLVIAGAVAA